MASETIAVTSPAAWFLMLVVICIAGPHVFGVPPRARRQWTFIAITIAFLAWVLLLMAPLRSR
jgi:hypothetical protein